MPKIDAGKYGYCNSGNETNFTTARQTGASATNQPTSANIKVADFFTDAGKGPRSWRFFRFFCAFDTSSYSSGYTISNLTFNWRNTASTNCSPAICFPTFIFVKSTAQGDADTPLAVSDYYSSVVYSTAYSSNFNISTSAGDASVSLNSTAVTDFASGLLKVVMVQYGNDYSDTTSTSNMQQQAYANFSAGSSGYVPYIEFDAVATGWENDINGVVNSNIQRIFPVPVANIEEVIGVE
jgi:hypothetical protein